MVKFSIVNFNSCGFSFEMEFLCLFDLNWWFIYRNLNVYINVSFGDIKVFFYKNWKVFSYLNVVIWKMENKI